MDMEIDAPSPSHTEQAHPSEPAPPPVPQLASAQKPPLQKPIQSSPWLAIPKRRFICIEHPAVIKNTDKAVTTIGGEEALVTLAQTNADSGLQLRFRPDDPMQPAINSRTIATNNILLRVTIKRRRKRRRDAEGNVIREPEEESGKSVMEKIQESKGNYTIEPLGRLDKTVRFREMADFEWNSYPVPFVQKLKDTLLAGTYEGILKFDISKDRGRTDIDLLPPPRISNASIPHTYNYRQNPAIKKSLVDGKAALLNFQAGPKTFTPIVNKPDSIIPGIPPGLPPYEVLDKITRECIDHLRLCFQQRPIWTRRALYNHFPKHLHPLVRFSMAHVAYMWRAGPWRDACVIYGLDPRLDPKYRMYQTVFFQMDTYRPKNIPADEQKESHVFDGKRITKDGRCFQLCDVTDPMVRLLIDTKDIRKSCNGLDGWYRHSTMAKIKTLMRTKIKAITEETEVPEEDLLEIVHAESENEEEEARRMEREAAIREQRPTRRKAGAMHTKRYSLYNVTPRGKKSKKRGAKSGAESGREGGPSTEQNAGEEGEEGAEGDEEEGEDEGAGDWDKELEAPDARMQKLMAEYAKQGDEGLEYDLEDEGDFDILGDDDDDDDGES